MKKEKNEEESVQILKKIAESSEEEDTYLTEYLRVVSDTLVYGVVSLSVGRACRMSHKTFCSSYYATELTHSIINQWSAADH